MGGDKDCLKEGEEYCLGGSRRRERIELSLETNGDVETFFFPLFQWYVDGYSKQVLKASPYSCS